MLGAIAGDVIGSIYEFDNIHSKDFPLFAAGCSYTDDTILSVALAECLLDGGDYAAAMKSYCKRYPDGGYGGRFRAWAGSERSEPYNSYGNGAAMRISPVAWAFGTMPEVLAQAERYTAVTHNHPEGIKGGQATAAAVFLARTGHTKEQLRIYIEAKFGYDLSRSVESWRPGFRFDESCQGTMPPALACFLDSTDFEDAIRNAISLGGDSDTLASITGSVAEAFYGGVPEPIARRALAALDEPMRNVVMRFRAKHPGSRIPA
jgi:ADP-ribosylglycohydrolase